MPPKIPFLCRGSPSETLIYKLAVTAMLLFALSGQVRAAGGAVTTMHAFAAMEGGLPTRLVQASDGNYYGTAATGGAISGNSGISFGSVFQLTPSGSLTVLHSFSGSDGSGPSALVIGPDGELYGTTQTGGANNAGTAFKITLSGVFTTLYSFQQSLAGGEASPGRLTPGNDGNFYGITMYGGDNSCGSIFQITPSGAVTTLYSFLSDSGASSGTDGLVLATDGSFYGATGHFLFKITTGGVMTPLHTFTDSEGSPTTAELVQGTDGTFYGTTELGGVSGAGSVFSFSPTGGLKTLYSFSATQGAVSAQPGGLADGGDGSFYGTLQFGGQAQCACGAIFKITPAGTLSMLYNFDGTSAGSNPVGTLMRGSDGYFYGTTQDTIYRFDSTVPPPPVISIAASPNVITVGHSTTLTWSATNATSCTASGAWIEAIATSGTESLSPTSIGPNTFTLTCTGTGGSVTASAVLNVNPLPSISLTLSPSNIKVGETATLSWSNTGTSASCTASGAWSGTQSSAGSILATPSSAGSYTYTLTCSSAAGDSSVNDSSTLVVTSTATGSGKSGGGAFGWQGLAGLAVILALRRGRVGRHLQRFCRSCRHAQPLQSCEA
jgi:uncharacterized repeat protein (TIGR03803 family)